MESVAFLWYLRHVSVMGGTFNTDSPNVQRFRRKGPEHGSRGQFIHASTWSRTWERIDEVGPRLIHAKRVKGHATLQHVREGTISLWQQAQELAGRRRKARLRMWNRPSRASVQGPRSWAGWLSS